MLTFIRLAALCACVTASPALAQPGRVTADVTPFREAEAVSPGGIARVALQVRLPEGLHVNSNRPRDPALIPLVLSIEPPDGITATEIVYPEPTDLVQKGADQPLRVFERDFLIGVRLDVGANVPLGEMTVPARLRYQACDEKMCYLPATAVTLWTLRIVAPGSPVARTNVEAFSLIAFGQGEAPSEAAAAPSTLDPSSSTPGNEAALAVLDDFTILATAAGYMGTEDFLRFIRNAEAGVKEQGWFEGRGPLAILFIVLLGGLALNLTPCVLPMIPINLAIIGAGVESGSRARGFLLGAAYGAAMALVYGVLGLIVILTAGTFGTINSSPWFNAGIGVLFVFLALAMFDVIAIDFSRLSNRLQVGTENRGSLLLAFTMGAVAALLAGACVAPVVIQVVLFSTDLYAAGITAALALPFLLGVGMALPWPLAGAGMAALPRPGAWMVRVKQVFGVIILATAAYYGYTAYGLFANRWVDPSAVTTSVAEKVKEGWHSGLAAGLSTAARERKPVLVDLWATWCKNCLTMDKTTLADPEVKAALSGYVKIKFQAETPDQDPARAVMKHFGALGLPTYVILQPR